MKRERKHCFQYVFIEVDDFDEVRKLIRVFLVKNRKNLNIDSVVRIEIRKLS